MAVEQEFSPEQKARAITIRTAQAPSMESYFSDVPNPQAPVPKEGQKPLADYFSDIEVPPGPRTGKEIVSPQSNPRIQEQLFKPEDGVDYATGIPLSSRINLYRASGEPGPNGRSEQEIYLENTYGKGNFRKDAGGNWVIKGIKPDQEVAAFPKEGLEGHLGNFDAALVGSIPSIGGVVAGTLGGAAAGGAVGGPPGAMAGGIAGSGLGAGLAHLADEGLKSAQGFYNKSPGTLALNTAGEVAMNSAFQGAGPAWNAGKQALYNNTSQWLRRFSGVTPETQALAHSLERLGVTPPIQSLAPDLKALSYQRTLRSNLSSDPMINARAAAVDQRVNEVLDGFNFNPAEKQAALDYINDVGSSRQPGRSGDLIYSAILNREAQLKGYEQAALTNARRLLQEQQTRWLEAKGTSSKQLLDVGDNVVGIYEARRKQFSTDMDTVYNAVHEAAGGKPVVDIADAVQFAQELLSATPGPVNKLAVMGHNRAPDLGMPPDTVAPDATLDEIKQMLEWVASKQTTGNPIAANSNNAVHDPIMVTIAEAHQLRSLIREKVRFNGSLNPIGPTRGDYWQLAGRIDDALENTAVGAEGTVGALMRDADRQYREGVVRFTNNDVNDLVMRAKAGRVPDPGEVADLLLLKNGRAAAKQIWDTLGETEAGDVVREQVKSADIRNIWRQALSASEFGPGGIRTLNPDTLVKMLDKRALVHDFMYPDKDPFLRAVRATALQMKALRGDFPIADLPDMGARGPMPGTPGGQVLRSLREAVGHQQELVREAQENVRASLSATDPQLRQAGARYIMADEARTVRAGQVLSPQEMEVLQREAAVELLRAAMAPTVKGSARTISGSGLEGRKGLGGLTDTQKNILFSNTQRADLELLARETKALFPEMDNDMGASLAAASIKSNLLNPTNAFKYGKAHVVAALADSATLRNVLAGTIRSDPYRGRRLLGYLAQGAANMAADAPGGPGQTSDVTQQPNFDQQMKALEAVHRPKPKGYQGPSSD